jgi:hypothetical protein
MSEGKLSGIGVIVGASIAAGAALLFVLVSLGRASTASAPNPTAAAPTLTAMPLPTTPAPTQMPSPIPASEHVLPDVAPDFTLQGPEGLEFTLSRQLAQGPVVLVFFPRGGG